MRLFYQMLSSPQNALPSQGKGRQELLQRRPHRPVLFHTPQRQLANMARVCALGQLSPLPLVVPLEDLQRLQVVTLHRGLESHSLDHGQPHHEHLAGMDR